MACPRAGQNRLLKHGSWTIHRGDLTIALPIPRTDADSQAVPIQTGRGVCLAVGLAGQFRYGSLALIALVTSVTV